MLRSALDGKLAYVPATAFLLKRIVPFFAIVGLSLWAEDEVYPLSSFPMYKSFSDSTYAVHVADGEDNPIASMPELQVRTSIIRKNYHRQLNKVQKRYAPKVRLSEISPELKRKAGMVVLEDIRRSHAAATANQYDVLRLYEITITLDEAGGFRRNKLLVGEHRLKKGEKNERTAQPEA